MNLLRLSQRNPVKIVVDASQYDITNDNRFLVPYIVYEDNEIRYGFVDRNGNIAIPAKYDKVFDDFYSESDLVRVGKRFCINYGTDANPRNYYYFKCGIIDSKGNQLISCNKYEELYFTAHKTLLIAHGNRLIEAGCALIDLQGNTLIPMGLYWKIGNVAHGFARTQDNNGWGVTDLEGNQIIPSGLFEEIWQLDEQHPQVIVRQKGIRYTISIDALTKLQDELKTTGGISTPIEQFLHYKEYLQRDFMSANSSIERLHIEKWLP